MALTRHIFATLALCLLTAIAVAADKKFTLVIDAGHGGNDAGAKGKISKEKNINLNVALAFGRLVEQNCPDVKLIYTRKSDVFIPLHERANIANKNKADLFVSIHTNALPDGKISRGLETYTLGMHRAGDNFDVAKRENAVILYESDYKQRYEGFNPNSSESYIMFEFLQDKNMEQSVELAKFVQKRTCASANRQNKGVKQAGFLVLRETSMPSCLIELGFISTPDEEQYLNTDQGVNSLAFGIFQAFCEYRAKYDRSVTVPFRATQYEGMPQPKKDDARKIAKVDKKEPDSEPVQASAPVADSQANDVAPVFKVQILTSGRELNVGNSLLKGVTDAQYYKENGVYKYTVGASEDPNEMLRLRKMMLGKFPEAFVIAFRGSEKMNVNEAINEYKRRKAGK